MLNRLTLGVLLVLPLLTLAQTAVKTPALKAKAHAAKPVPVEEPPLLALSPEQLAIAGKVQSGRIPCELATTVSIEPHAESPGRFLLTLGRQQHVMEPVVTSTGAVRLESAGSGMVWIQLANKSMLMDQKQGKRLADECMTLDQRLVADALVRSPAPNLLEPLNPVQVASDPKPQGTVLVSTSK